MKSNSCGTGSFTFMIMSAARHTSSADDTNCAPAFLYRSSGSDEPSAAPSSMSTVCPASTSSRAPSGVRATRNSLSLTSRGTPTITRPPLFAGPSLPPPVAGKKEGDRGLRIGDPSAAHGVEGVVELHRDDLDALVLGPAAPFRSAQEELDALVGEAERGVDRAETFDLACRVPGLLPKLSDRAFLGRLPLHVEDPGRDLERLGSDGLPDLLDQDDVVVVERDDRRRARVPHELPSALRPGLDDHADEVAVEDLDGSFRFEGHRHPRVIPGRRSSRAGARVGVRARRPRSPGTTGGAASGAT